MSLLAHPNVLIAIPLVAALGWGGSAYLWRTAKPITIDMYAVDRHLPDCAGKTLWRELSARASAELGGMRAVRMGAIGHEVHAINPMTRARCVLMWKRDCGPSPWWKKAVRDFVNGYRSAAP